MRLDKRGAGGNVENSPAPDSHPLPADIADTPDPLRLVDAWAASAAEGLVGIEDLELLRRFIDEARDEIRRDFVPLALAVGMARAKDGPR